jgi:hypothetical protein
VKELSSDWRPSPVSDRAEIPTPSVFSMLEFERGYFIEIAAQWLMLSSQ